MPHNLRTDRLVIRPITLRDAEPLWRILNWRDLVRNTGSWPYPFTAAYARERYRPFAPGGPKAGAMMTILEGRRLAGTIGLHPAPDGMPVTDIGYWIGDGFGGRGIATEACRAVTNHALSTLRLPAVHARVFADNDASRRVVEKVGYRLIGCGEGPSVARGHLSPDRRYVCTRETLR